MMIISVDNVVEYLLEKKLIDIESIVESDLNAIDISRNRPNIKVIRQKAKSYLLKQLDLINSRVPDIHPKEVLLYGLVRSDPTFSFLQDALPRVYDFDTNYKILITEFFQNHTSLWDLYLSKNPKNWNTDIAAALAAVMGNYHLKFESILQNDLRFYFLTRKTPWILSAHRPGPEILSNLTPEAIHITKIIQNYDISNELERLRNCWRTETLIHGDIRWDNVLVSDSEHDATPRLKLIDWELADYGDSAWDIAGVMNSYLVFWILNQTQKREPSTRYVFTPEYPLSEIWPSIRTFWFAYIKARKLKTTMVNELLIRSAKFSAAKLIQTAYELQPSPRFVGQSIMMVQAGKNIFHKPEDAIVHLFGIPFELRV
jgi:hypothetical protein